MGELQGVRSGKADKGAEGRDLPEMPDAGADAVAGQPAAGELAEPSEVKSRVRQVWGAYTLDDNGLELVLFGRELEGYRHAANNGMRCKPIQFGKSVMQQLGQQK
jgi:hypothetical protein